VTGTVPDDENSGEFGANEWLVDEMYERYLIDKNSVDQSWWPILEGYHPVKDPTPTTSIPVVETQAPEAPAPEAPAAAPQAPAAAPEPPTAAPESPAAGAPAPVPAAEPAPQTGATPIARTTSAPAKPQPIPAEAPQTAQTPVVEGEEPAEPQDEVTQLKGMSKTLASNMDASLSVPTATSVRTVPAKLMIDNRIVINNHLKRARGGKVSFTHLIAWAMVKVLKDFPSQNVYYDEPDGKPSVVAPAHINLGIAIDLPKPDGTRSLLVPGIKRADTMTFAEFLAAYEDVVARARTNKLTAADFQGTRSRSPTPAASEPSTPSRASCAVRAASSAPARSSIRPRSRVHRTRRSRNSASARPSH
jgi:2-oxoglutarate dehydrogenase E1 component